MGERTWVMLDLAIILRSVQSLYVVELKSSLRTHLARFIPEGPVPMRNACDPS
jgi:hypothetical protein